MTEWEPVEVEKKEIEEFPEKITVDEEKVEEVFEQISCTNCGTEIQEGTKYCSECGNDLYPEKGEKEEKIPEPIEKKLEEITEEEPAITPEPTPVFIPVEEVEEEEEQIEVEAVPSIEELPIEEPGIDREVKLGAFKDIESIDDETAVLLYDNGITTIDSITTATIKDLTKIKGIKRKTAKKIKKEIEKKSEWEPVEVISEHDVEEKDSSLEIKPIAVGDTAEGEITEELVQEEEEIIGREVKIEAFKDMESINDGVAVILYDSGFTSIGLLKETRLKDLTKIKGIKRKQAKEIYQEIEKKIEEAAEAKPIEMGDSATREKTEEQVQDDEVVEEKQLQPSPVELSKTVEWEPIQEEEIKEKEEVPEITDTERASKIEVFKDIESIDDETAVLLYNNGVTTKDSLTTATIKDLTKIKGIKRKTAKKIKKEIEKKSEWGPVEIEPKDEDFSKGSIDEEEIEKDEASEIDEIILEYEPEETSDEFFKEEEIEETTIMMIEDEEVFKEIDSIDDKIAKLLQENGIDSIDKLNNTTIKGLTKIRGIKRKIAKKIKQEVNELIEKTETSEEETFERGENPFIYDDEEEDEDHWESYDEDKISVSKMKEIKGFKHKDYNLYEKEIEVKSGKKRTVRFFSKAEPDEGKPIELPKDYEVKENKKTGVPYLRKKR